MATIEKLLHHAYGNWDDPTALAHVGRELEDRNRLDHARRILERAVELEPTNEESWTYLAYAHLRGFGDADGLETLRRGIEATGSDGLKATLAGFADDPKETAKLFEDIAESAHPGAKAGLLSRRFREEEDKKAVLSDFQTLVEAHGDDPDVRNTFFWTLLGAKAQGVIDDDALRGMGGPLADRRVTQEPDRIASHWMAIQLHQAAKDWDAVLEATERALVLFPDDETLMQVRGRAFKEKEDPDRAAHWFARAIGAKPSFVGARIDLGRLHESRDRLDLAEEVFREIPSANPDYAAGPISLALFLGRRDQWDEAEEIFLKAWARMPDWYKGMMGQNPEVKAFFERESVKGALE